MVDETSPWVVGAAGGAALGSVVPGIGTAIGGFVGGLVGAIAGGSAASAASKYPLDGLIVDDAKEMVELLPAYLEPLATDYLLSEAETKAFSEVVHTMVKAELLRSMYQSTDRAAFVYAQFEPACQTIIAKRERVEVPDAADVQEALSEVEKELSQDEPSLAAAA